MDINLNYVHQFGAIPPFNLNLVETDDEDEDTLPLPFDEAFTANEDETLLAHQNPYDYGGIFTTDFHDGLMGWDYWDLVVVEQEDGSFVDTFALRSDVYT